MGYNEDFWAARKRRKEDEESLTPAAALRRTLNRNPAGRLDLGLPYRREAAQAATQTATAYDPEDPENIPRARRQQTNDAAAVYSYARRMEEQNPTEAPDWSGLVSGAGYYNTTSRGLANLRNAAREMAAEAGRRDPYGVNTTVTRLRSLGLEDAAPQRETYLPVSRAVELSNARARYSAAQRQLSYGTLEGIRQGEEAERRELIGRRDNAARQLETLNGSAGGLVERNLRDDLDATQRRLEELYEHDRAAERQAQLEALSARSRRELERLGMVPTVRERVNSTLTAGILGAAGNAAEAASNLLELNNLYEANRLNAQSYDLHTGRLRTNGANEARLQRDSQGNVVGVWPGNGVSDDVQRLRDASDRLSAAAERHRRSALSYTNAAGRLAVNAGVSGVQMLGDMLLNKIVPGAGLAALGVRAYGGGVREARQAGASAYQQAAYGAVSATIEVLTEKMFSAFGSKQAYGAGFQDDVIDRLYQKIAKDAELTRGGRALLRVLLAGAEEGSEELIAGLAEPWAKTIYAGGDALSAIADPDYWAEVGYETLVGAALGMVGESPQVTADAVFSGGTLAANVYAGGTTDFTNAYNDAVDERAAMVAERNRDNPLIMPEEMKDFSEYNAAYYAREDLREAGKLGDAGASAMATVATERMSLEDTKNFEAEMFRYYRGGLREVPFTAMSGSGMLTEDQAFTIWDAGRADRAARRTREARERIEAEQAAQQAAQETAAARGTAETAQEAAEAAEAAEAREGSSRTQDETIRTQGGSIRTQDETIRTQDESSRTQEAAQAAQDAQELPGVSRDNRAAERAESRGDLGAEGQISREVTEDEQQTENRRRVDDLQRGDEGDGAGTGRNAGISAEPGGQRLAGWNVEREARFADNRARAARVRAAVQAQGTELSSAAARGIENGTDRATALDVQESDYDDELRGIARDNEARGIKTRFTVGALEVTDSNGRPFLARGVFSADGKTVWIQADNEYATPTQIARHEQYHAAQRADPELNERVRRAILSRYDEAALRELVRAYEKAYGTAGLSVDEVLEEIYADNYAGIDIFEYLTGYEGATRFGTTAAEQIAQGAETGTESIRGPPKTSYSERYPESGQEVGGLEYSYIEENDNEAKETALSEAYDKVNAENRSVIIPAELLSKYKAINEDPSVKLKDAIKAFYDEYLKGKQVSVKLNNGTVDIKFENDGKKKSVGWRMKPEKAATFEKLLELLQTSEYAYSEINRDAKESGAIPRFHYFVGDAIVSDKAEIKRHIPVKIQVRDMLQWDGSKETRYYYHNLPDIKSKHKDSGSNSPVDHGPEAATIDSNAYTSASDEMIPYTHDTVKTQTSREALPAARDEADLRGQNHALRRRVAELQELLAAQARQHAPDRPAARPSDIRAVARRQLETYSSTLKTADIEGDILKIWEALHERKGVAAYAEAKELAADTMRRVIESAEVMVNANEVAEHKDLLRRLKDPMTITVTDSHDLAPDDWGGYRKSVMKYVRVSINGKGTPVDVRYSELSEAYPYFFPPDVAHPAEQLERMVEIAQTLQPVYENPYDRNMAEAIEYGTNDLLNTLLDRTVVRSGRTRSESRAMRELNEERERARERIGSIVQEKNQKIEEVRGYYRAQETQRAQRRAESRDRERLLRIARRLQNRKMPQATRALVNQYIGDLDTIAQKLTDRSIQRLSNLRDWYDEQRAKDENFLKDERIEKTIARLSKRHIKELSTQEVADLTAALQAIEKELADGRKLLESQDRRDIGIMGREVIDNVQATKGVNSYSFLSSLGDTLATEVTSPLRAIRRLTGYAENDPLYRRVEELQQGEFKALDYTRRALERFERFTRDKKFMDRIAGKNAQEIELAGHRMSAREPTHYAESDTDATHPGKVVLSDPVTVKITPAMRISLYLHAQNHQNLKHIMNGGIKIPDIKLYKAGKIAAAYSNGTRVRLAPLEIRNLTDGMSEMELAFADAAMEYFNSMSKDAINETSLTLKGYELALVDNYFPINTDSNFKAGPSGSLVFDNSITGFGWLNERINSGNPVNLFDVNEVLVNAIDQHARYYGLAIPVRNFNKLYTMIKPDFPDNGGKDGYNTSVREVIDGKWKKPALNYIDLMMAQIQGSSKTEPGWLGNKLDRLRGNYAGGTLNLNAGVTAKQVASYPTAAAVLGWKPLARAMKYLNPRNNLKIDTKLINEYTPLLWQRSRGFKDAELKDIGARKNVVQKAFGKPWMNWIQAADLLTTRALWKASEFYVQEQQPGLYETWQNAPENKAKEARDAYYRAVAEIYNKTITETQPNYTVMERPQLLRSENAIVRNLFNFKTQVYQNANIVYDAFGALDAKRRAALNAGTQEAKAAYSEARANVRKAVTSQAAQLAVISAINLARALLRGDGKKYEDEEERSLTAGSVARGVGIDMLSNAAGMVPGGDWAASAVLSLADGGKYYGPEALGPSAVNEFINAAISYARHLESVAGSGEAPDWNTERLKLDKLLNITARTAGIPYGNVRNLVNTVYLQGARLATGDEYLGNYMHLALITDPESDSAAYYDNLYRAWRGRDKSPGGWKDLYRRMIADGWDEKKIKNGMESRMKKDEGVGSVEELRQRWSAPG